MWDLVGQPILAFTEDQSNGYKGLKRENLDFQSRLQFFVTIVLFDADFDKNNEFHLGSTFD